MLQALLLSVVRLNFRLRRMRMPSWRSKEDNETVRGTVLPTNPDDATLADLQAQLVQLLGHAKPAIAAQA